MFRFGMHMFFNAHENGNILGEQIARGGYIYIYIIYIVCSLYCNLNKQANAKSKMRSNSNYLAQISFIRFSRQWTH